MNRLGDIRNSRWLYIKAIPFFATGVIASTGTRSRKKNLITLCGYIKWPGDVATSFRNDGDTVRVTLDILPHDYRIFRVEEVAK